MGKIKVVSVDELDDGTGDAEYTFELDDEMVAYLDATYPNLELNEQLQLFIDAIVKVPEQKE